MERSMKYRPTISISDVAHLMAKHGNRTVPGFFHPNEGRIAPATIENIKKVEGGEKFHISCLIEKQNEYVPNNSNSNPITGSNSHFALFDWFHQDNCKKEEEILRKSSSVHEISGLVDTQAVEQLFSSCKKDLYFMNNLSPTNHLFVFRLICHLRNQKKNTLMYKRQSNVFDILERNEFGQVCGGFTDVNIPEASCQNDVVGDVQINEQSSGQVTKETTLNDQNLEPCETSITTVPTELPEKQKGKQQNAEIYSLRKRTPPEDFSAEWSELCDMLDAVLASSDQISSTEQNALLSNIKYAREVLFAEPSNQRKSEVQVCLSDYGYFQVQGFSNFCGLCALNNAVGDIANFFSIEELNTIADRLWLSMIQNPSHGVLQQAEPMRDKEGFYSVEVLRTALGTRGFEMIQLNPQSIQDFTSEDAGQIVLETLTREYGFATLIIRPASQHHWVTIRELDKTLLYLDSAEEAPEKLEIKQMGAIVSENCRPPGAVFFVTLKDLVNQDVSSKEISGKVGLCLLINVHKCISVICKHVF